MGSLTGQMGPLGTGKHRGDHKEMCVCDVHLIVKEAVLVPSTKGSSDAQHRVLNISG